MIHPGSDFSLFQRKDPLTQPSNCIGMVYRLEKDKLNENSIDVFIKVVQNRPDTTCLIVGDGSLKPTFESAVAKAGVSKNFVFTGYVNYEELPSFYEKMSIFVAPVWKESFGQVSSFAMNMYLPVTGFSIGALPSIIDNEKLMASFGDTEGLAKIIIKLLDDPKQRLDIGRKNHERAQGEYSVIQMIEKYSYLYKQLSEDCAP